ncbi:MAG: glycoside hydrolase 5 family protein [Anaerolineae bacterium]
MRRFSSVLMAVLVVVSTVAVSMLPAGAVTGQGLEPAAGGSTVDVTSVAGGTVFLPVSMQDYPRLPNTFGVQMHAINEPQGLSLAERTGASLVRFNAFDWRAIEPQRTNPPTYLWSAVDEASLINAASRGMQVIATVKYTPSWAQKLSGTICGPMKADAFDEYAQFLAALVRRYSAAPYNVRYWELGNEVDIDPAAVPADSGYGCWGDRSDEYYGGGFYAEMLKVAYPAIKAADPRAQVMIGGLLVGPDCSVEGDACTKSRRFFEGVLHAGGGPFFDIVSFHGYALYNGTLRWDQQLPFWGERGGIVLGKVAILRDTMRSYGLDKPIMHTEGGLVCKEDFGVCNPVGDAFYQAQADYVAWLYVRNMAAGLTGTIWYDFRDGGWRSSGLLDPNGAPRPAYYAFKFLTEELHGATYRGRVDQAGLAGYAFTAPGRRVWVLWAADEAARTIALPAGTIRALDKYGNVIDTSAGTVTVKSPVYLELTP